MPPTPSRPPAQSLRQELCVAGCGVTEVQAPPTWRPGSGADPRNHPGRSVEFLLACGFD